MYNYDAISNQQSAISNQQSAISNQQSDGYNVNQWLVKLYALRALKAFAICFIFVSFIFTVIILSKHTTSADYTTLVKVLLCLAILLYYAIAISAWFHIKRILHNEINSLTSKEILRYSLAKSCLSFAILPLTMPFYFLTFICYTPLALYGKLTKRPFSKLSIFWITIIPGLPIMALHAHYVAPDMFFSDLIMLISFAIIISRKLNSDKAFYYDANNGEDANRKAVLAMTKIK